MNYNEFCNGVTSPARNINSGFDHGDVMRKCVFRPFKAGPGFTLELYYLGGDRIGYKLTMKSKPGRAGEKTVIFEGRDFRPSPLHSVDGDETVKALMGFLCLRKGDTDSEYFENYDHVQWAFSDDHAESLQMEVYNRFGYDD